MEANMMHVWKADHVAYIYQLCFHLAFCFFFNLCFLLISL